MKVGLRLMQTDYDFRGEERLHIYLTNALTQAVSEREAFGAGFLAKESFEASGVKSVKPITVVIGNPPYSGHSMNKNTWIDGPLRDYYFVDGQPLGERNPKWLNDDYVKFIRFGQWRISQTGAGILAMITNHGYLDNPTFRGMRQQLMTGFDKIYILDLHGSLKKQERPPEGHADHKDENVFDIQPGVAIILAVRLDDGTNTNCEVWHADLWGHRTRKYDTLAATNSQITDWLPVSPSSPFYLFIPQNISAREEYLQGWSITGLLPVNVLGFQTHRDDFAINFDREVLYQRISGMRDEGISDDEFRETYGVTDNWDWQLSRARARIRADEGWETDLIDCLYRPFDKRPCYFSEVAMDRPRRELIDHVVGKENLVFGLGRQGSAVSDPVWHLIMCSTIPVDANIFRRGGINLFPLYLYPIPGFDQRFETSAWQLSNKGRRPNLNPVFIQEVSEKLNLSFLTEGQGDCSETFGPEDIFHYAYAIFHSLTYRIRFGQFLDTDFPRLPQTSNLDLFRWLCALGADLVALHLLEDHYKAASWNQQGAESPLTQPITQFVEGHNGTTVGAMSVSKAYDPQTQRVYLDTSNVNHSSYFEGVPPEVWAFQIGGYQVCHKWLYDRRAQGGKPGRTLTEEDISHYQRVVVALYETIRLMGEIDTAIDQHGGWPIQ